MQTSSAQYIEECLLANLSLNLPDDAKENTNWKRQEKEGEGDENYMLSLTLEDEYMEYRGQGKRATPEEMFKMSPLRLKDKEAKFQLFCCLITSQRGRKQKGSRERWGNFTLLRLPSALSALRPRM